jgi:hypothetical protein
VNVFKNKNIFEWAYVLLMACVFIVLASYSINHPGLYYDEALFVNAATGATQSDLFVHRRVLGVPVMLMSYIGALKAWIYYPIFKIFDISIASIRFPAILLGAASIILLYWYVSQQFSKVAAVIFLALAAIEPSTIFHSRLDWGPTALMMVFRGGLFVSLGLFLKTGEKQYLRLAVLCCAIGIFDKLNFVWIALAGGVSAVVFYPERFNIPLISRLGTQKLLILVSAGVILIFIALTVRATGGANPTGELGFTDIVFRWNQFFSLFAMTVAGTGVYDFVITGSNPARSHHAIALTAGAIASIFGITVGLRSNLIRPQALGFLVLFAFLLAAQIFITRKATGPHHFATLAPLWLVFFSIGIWSLIEGLKPFRWPLGFAAGAVLTSGLTVTSIMVDLGYHRGFRNININPLWSVTSGDLVQRIGTLAKVGAVVAVDWGVATNVQAISNNELAVYDMWSFFNDPKNKTELNWFAKTHIKKGSIFVLHTPERSVFPNARNNFLGAIAQENWPINHVFSVYSTDGTDFFEVYRVLDTTE